MAVADPLQPLTAAGIAVWLDDLPRDRLTSGNLALVVVVVNILRNQNGRRRGTSAVAQGRYGVTRS